MRRRVGKPRRLRRRLVNLAFRLLGLPVRLEENTIVLWDDVDLKGFKILNHGDNAFDGKWIRDGTVTSSKLDPTVSDEIAKAVWSYENRSLTAPTPFYREVIEGVLTRINAPADTWSYYDVFPPSGEIWWLFGGTRRDTHVDSNITIGMYDKTNDIRVWGACLFNEDLGGVYSSYVITSNVGFSFGFNNYSSSSERWEILYSGFVLGTRIRRYRSTGVKWCREVESKDSIPSLLRKLDVVEVYDEVKGEYRPVVKLEWFSKINEVSYLTVVSPVEDAERILQGYRDYTKRPKELQSLSSEEYLEVTGWRKYVEKWLKKGRI